ncbi:MAG: SWIM zinc finger family protein, partial [Sandaracinaceae bacterium]|nr:SWIM zinc finger family protein [Sandaracinaceae bacterium]
MSVRATPDLLPTITAAAPARVVKRLDADRDVARAWTWNVGDAGGTVVTDGGETVKLVAQDGVVSSASEVSCSCLLSPRCLHVLAVVAALEIADAAPVAAVAEAAPKLEPDATSAASAALAVARHAQTVAGDLLASGARGVGAVLEGELLRVVHAARLEGLHRLAAAGLRVVRDVRDQRGDAADFASTTLVADLHDQLSTALLLQRPAVDPSAVGVARRAYDTVGNLRLFGICTEPVIARGGMAGVVTHLIDERGGLWSIGDVQRGDIGRALGAYDASLVMGDTTISHRALSRAGLFVQDATASEDRRLGAGRQVKAVRAQAELGLAAEAIRARLDEPLEQQVARVYAGLLLPGDRRSRGA